MRSIRVLLALAGFGLMAGCGSGSGETEVSGVVLMDGQPLSGAVVLFVPAEGTKGPGSRGATDAEGKFTLVNPQGVKGAIPGKYKVTVSKTNAREPKEGEKMVITDARDIQETLPAIYSNLEKTSLTATVESGGKPIELRLESKKTAK
jgi:hypothetical protein